MSQIDSCVFESDFTCNADSFLLSEFNISNSQFKSNVEIVNNYYKYGIEINNSTFDSTLDLSASNFETSFLIQDSKIRNFSITHCSFVYRPNFRRIELVDTVDFSNIDFEKGVDIREESTLEKFQPSFWIILISHLVN